MLARFIHFLSMLSSEWDCHRQYLMNGWLDGRDLGISAMNMCLYIYSIL